MFLTHIPTATNLKIKTIDRIEIEKVVIQHKNLISEYISPKYAT